MTPRERLRELVESISDETVLDLLDEIGTEVGDTPPTPGGFTWHDIRVIDGVPTSSLSPSLVGPRANVDIPRS